MDNWSAGRCSTPHLIGHPGCSMIRTVQTMMIRPSRRHIQEIQLSKIIQILNNLQSSKERTREKRKNTSLCETPSNFLGFIGTFLGVLLVEFLSHTLHGTEIIIYLLMSHICFSQIVKYSSHIEL